MTNVELCDFLRDSLKLWGVEGVVLCEDQDLKITNELGTEIIIRREVVAGEPAVWRVRAALAEGSRTRFVENHSVVALLRNLKALLGAEDEGRPLRVGITPGALV